jgi:hypothetical protein
MDHLIGRLAKMVPSLGMPIGPGRRKKNKVKKASGAVRTAIRSQSDLVIAN